ncbi:MAG TPA: nucleotidyltransferase domain-containing protein [Bryobacteraceae bacterium]|jgi:predicted nucleotidyltransferase|nr:nucleotidyltransferase domain-containing protein [Bryobacteraceae bacterium]
MTDTIPLPRANPILAKFRAALAEMYGDRLERIVLFGFPARGDAQPNSDYDVAVFLNGMNGAPDRWAELHRLAALRVKFIDETGAFFEAKPYPAGAYRERSPLMHEIRREGLDL